MGIGVERCDPLLGQFEEGKMQKCLENQIVILFNGNN